MTAKDLKNALLQEAVQGKLVPQIASEGNTRDLLEEIRKEKLSYGLDFAFAKSGKRKSKKETALAGSNPCDIKEEEIPFDIPESWCWCRLGELVYNHGQKTPEQEFSYIDIGSIDNEHQKLNEKENFIQPDKAPSRARKIVKFGDVIYSTVRPYLHNMCIIDKEFTKEPIASTGFAVMTSFPGLLNKYLFYYLLSPTFNNYANDTDNAKGVAYPAINDDKLYKGIVPLPPLSEQKRIVAAIEKFMPLIEEYGKKETQLKAINEKIGTLTKKAILQEAVQGKLVPQKAAEGNARNLLEEIQKEKLSHGLDFANAKSGKRKSKKETALAGSNPCDITEEEIPFDIPENWCWCRLGEIVPFGTCKNAEPNEIEEEDWILDLEDIEKDSGKILAFKTKKQIDAKSTKHVFIKGNVLYSKLRPYLNKCVIAPKNGFCTSEILPLDFGEHIYNKYAQLYLMSPFFVDYTNSLSFGVKMPRLGTEDGKKALFPLPPLAEQKRIVEAIENLLPLCEALKI